jgi:hypothetical protein
MSADVAYGEDGSVVESVDFPFHELDGLEVVGELKPLAADLAGSSDEIIAQLTVAGIERVFDWIFQDGMNNSDGLMQRTKVALWNLHRVVNAEYTLTSLAGEDEKHKQSFGRHHDSFKRRFPELINVHNRRK